MTSNPHGDGERGQRVVEVPGNMPLSGMRQLDLVTATIAGYPPVGRQQWVLLRTADGGETWHLVTPATAASRPG